MPPVPARNLQALFTFGIVLAMGIFALAIPAQAQVSLNGQYRCTKVEVNHRTANCQSPPLMLHRDGSYQIWGEHGTYQVVKGRWLLLSHSKRRGLGHFQSINEIVFEYRISGLRYKVTFSRTYEAIPGFHRA